MWEKSIIIMRRMLIISTIIYLCLVSALLEFSFLFVLHTGLLEFWNSITMHPYPDWIAAVGNFILSFLVLILAVGFLAYIWVQVKNISFKKLW